MRNEHLAAAISSLLDDPERVRRMGKQGRKVVMERFSMNNMANSILDVYNHHIISMSYSK